jgi:hypothetical protein
MPTVITRTVKPSGGDYTSVRDALFALQPQFGDLVAQDAILRIECYAMEDTGRIDITGDWTTDADHFIHIVAAPGHRHRGKWSTDAYRLVVDDFYWAVNIVTSGVRLEGLQIENRHVSDSASAAGIWVSPAVAEPRLHVDGCIIRRPCPLSIGENRGIGLHYTAGSIRVRNTVIYGYRYGFYWSALRSGAELLFYNNTLYGAGDINFVVSSQESPYTLRVKNNLCVGGAAADYAFYYTPPTTADYARNLSSDASAPGSDAIHDAQVTFADAACGDLHLSRMDTAARGQGADLSGDPWWAFWHDVDGQRRRGRWSIGADQPHRREEALEVRVKAALIAYLRPHPEHVMNGEEWDYPFIANYSKALPHDGCGIVDPAAYHALLDAVESGDPADFEAIPLGGQLKLTNPQAGLAFDLEGPDAAAVTIPPAPRIDSPQNSSEAGELYWMALARDVWFGAYAWDSTVQAAVQSLNSEFSDFRGPRQNGIVTPQTVFRGIFPGETVGPYVSQFLLKGTSDPRLPAGQGRCATDGFITYGELKIDQRQVTVLPGIDYLTDFPTWLDAQNGWDFRGQDAVDTSARRFVRNLRDLGERVHIDNVVDHFYNAAHILLNEVPGDQLCGTGRVAVDREFRDDPGNPYSPPPPQSATQVGFVTFGPAHAVTLVTEVLTRALQATWFQKWFVHRRFRPEEFGGRLEAMLRRGCGPYPINHEIVNSLTAGLLAAYYVPRFGTYLLAQQFPEGAPTHPAYAAGHATGAGACATILKAFFDDLQPIENPVMASADGLSLIAYTGADAGAMTVGGELNKLAGNVAIGRNAAGVHWRTDYDQSLLLGEAVAIGILQEQSIRYNENRAGTYFELTKFDGTRIRIQDGEVTAV